MTGVQFLDENLERAISTLIAWVGSEAEGQLIIDGWRRERRIPKEHRDNFFSRLQLEFRKGTNDPSLSVAVAIHPSDQLLLSCTKECTPRLLANVGTVEKLLELLRKRGLETVSPADAPRFSRFPNWIKTEILHRLGERYRSTGKKKDIVWWTDDEMIWKADSPASLVDILGLCPVAYPPGQHLFVTQCRSDDTGMLAVPTVLDAGWNPRFIPEDPGTSWGRTHPHSKDKTGLKEWVGRPPLTNNVVFRIWGRIDGK
ncbi:MAG: hypothetical protein AAF799_42595 [Myxococcota bacterium]